MKNTIVIVGAGHIGQALGAILTPHNTVLFWDTKAGLVPEQKELSDIIPRADIILLGVPGAAIRQATANILPYLKPHTIIVTFSKGIEAGSHATIDEVLAQTLPANQPFAFIGGPMLAKEITEGKPAIGVCGCSNRTTFSKLRKTFKNTAIRLEYSKDIHGVAVCGVLKNIYTLPVGIAAGLGLGNNAAGWLMNKGILEMQSLLPLLGGQKKTLYTAAGLGDFIATATSPDSTNYRAGEEFGRLGTSEIRGEGIAALPSLLALIGANEDKTPLLTCIKRIIINHENPAAVLTEYFTRK
jgi:glycerol-3-phosphate dehydrogenase (NAD(P)+)